MVMNTNPMMLYYSIHPVLSKNPNVIPVALKKQVLDGKSSCSQEDRISKKTWHENITRPELIAAHKQSIREQRIRYAKRLISTQQSSKQTLFNPEYLSSYLSVYKMKCKQACE